MPGIWASAAMAWTLSAAFLLTAEDFACLERSVMRVVRSSHSQSHSQGHSQGHSQSQPRLECLTSRRTSIAGHTGTGGCLSHINTCVRSTQGKAHCHVPTGADRTEVERGALDRNGVVDTTVVSALEYKQNVRQRATRHWATHEGSACGCRARTGLNGGTTCFDRRMRTKQTERPSRRTHSYSSAS